MHENGEKKEGQNSLSVLNYTQITTNNISGLLCRSRPLSLIPETLNLETKLSLKNEIVKNTSQNISTWSYENRVSKHFVIDFSQLPLSNSLTYVHCVVCLCRFFLFLFFHLCRSGCKENNYYLTPPPLDFFSLPTILSLTQVTVI